MIIFWRLKVPMPPYPVIGKIVRLVRLFFISNLALEFPNVGLKITAIKVLFYYGGIMKGLFMNSNV